MGFFMLKVLKRFEHVCFKSFYCFLMCFVFKVFSRGRVILYIVSMAFSLPKTLVKTPVKNMVKHLGGLYGPFTGL